MLKPVIWVGSTKRDLKKFPNDVQDELGHVLCFAQRGEKHNDAKPLKGFSGANTLEIVENFDGNTYRAIYTIKFAGAVYALHAFQKKSTKGISTPKHEMELIKARLKIAEEHYAEWCKEQGPK